MNYFKISEKINQQKDLKLEHKAILNQILSYQLNGKDFIATNQYLSEYWNISVRTVNRVIAHLKKLSIIDCNLIRKKHQTGEKTWYNKRYIKIDTNKLLSFLAIEQTISIKENINTEIESPVIQSEIVEKQIEQVVIDEPIESERNNKTIIKPKEELYALGLKSDEIINLIVKWGFDKQDNVTLGELVNKLVERSKEAKYNDYEGTKITSDMINKLKLGENWTLV